jgi:drug/metabolite transporter (DMT)-like permease
MEHYIFWSFISVITLTLYHVILKQFQIDGHNNTLALIWLHITMIIFLCISYYKNNPNDFGKIVKVVWNDHRFLLMAIIGGLFSYITHDFGYYAYLQFRNPGYFEAIINSESVLLAVLSVYLFNSHFGLREIFGAILVLIGVVIISWREYKK